MSDRYVDLVQEGIDMAIRIGRLPDSNLVARHIGICRMVICAAPGLVDRLAQEFGENPPWDRWRARQASSAPG